MKAIRYSIHFPCLIAAVLMFWLVKGLALPAWISDLDFLVFGLMGAIHATCIVVSLRDRKVVRPIIAFCFVMLAAVWSAATPFVVLFGTVWSAPVIEKIVPPNSGPSDLSGILFLLVGSAIGSSGYWLLVRLFC